MIDIPLQQIGKYLGNKDHTTVMHGYDKIKKDLETNETLQNTIDILKKKISTQPALVKRPEMPCVLSTI